MSEIKCLVCGGTHFRIGYFDAGTDVTVHSDVYNSGEVNIYSEVINQTSADSDILFS